MRVIAGSLKGCRLEAPSWEGLRPTSDKLRETIFNILGERVAGARVLDVYAGTGALGIEALSRGAAHATFVERDRRAQALIARNLDRCGIAKGYAIIRDTVARALDRLRSEPRFDIVLLDPPYDQAVVGDLAAVGALVGGEAVVVLEHARKREPPARAGSLRLMRQVKSGDSALALYACQP
jgi:16S rRNA (guanine(966)-N(2))-methyltransferase RsmD